MHHPFETYIMIHILNPAAISELNENVTLTWKNLTFQM